MPKRSNDFQRLIYLIRVNLAAGAKVTESKLLRDRRTKNFREVDVVIEGTVGGQPILVCIECRDHKRVADVQWVDAMKTKHERLDTNALMLASRSGFTPEALTVAKSYGIDTYTLEEPDEQTLRDRLNPSSSLWLHRMSVSPEKVTVTVGHEDGLPAEAVVTSPDNLLYNVGGTALSQIKQIVEQLLSTDAARYELSRNAAVEHKFFVLEWTPPGANTDGAIYMMKIEPTMLRLVTKISIVGPCKVEIGRFNLRQGRVGNVAVTWGKAVIGGLEAMAVATRDTTGDQTLSINFSGSVSAPSTP